MRKYLARFLMDPRIAPMNRVGWWFVLHLFILVEARARVGGEVREDLDRRGVSFHGCPQEAVRALDAQLAEEGHDAVVRCAMSYSAPFVRDAVRELKEAGCTRLVVLPLYPQSAHSTTGSVSDGVGRALRTRAVGRAVRLRGQLP